VKSFQLRVFVSAVIAASLLLLLVVASGNYSLSKYEKTRIENRMCVELKRLTRAHIDYDDSMRIWHDMTQKLHLNQKHDLAFIISPTEKSSNTKLIQTENWPIDFPIALPPATALTKLDDNKRSPCKVKMVNIKQTEWIQAITYNKTVLVSLIVNRDAAFAEINSSLIAAIKILIPIYVIASLIATWSLARLVVHPFNTISKAMNRIDKDELHLRIDPNTQYTEFHDLIQSYNSMLERLERSFYQASRFAANAAHELRTPLTILQGKLEQALNQSPSNSNHRELSQMLDEVTRLSHITKRLLFLAQAESGNFAMTPSTFDIHEMLQDLVGDLEMLATDKTIVCNPVGSILITADEILVRQLLTNLLSNAVKYALEKSKIHVQIQSDQLAVELWIRNSSHEISETERSHFFDSFYRGDPARTRNIDGTGLGLNVSFEIVKAHKGQIRLEKTSLNVVQIYLKLPRQAW
jgi:heavy metal sensor kinase